MGGLTLLAEARAAGLDVRARDDQVVVSGPRSQGVLAQRLLADKAAVLAELRRERIVADPRPDLSGDSALWSRLLALAYDVDGDDPAGLCGILNGLRCYGAALVESAGQVRLAAGEMTAAEYDQERRQYLVPHKNTLTMLLKRLSAIAA
jgi:hypothetical protein